MRIAIDVAQLERSLAAYLATKLGKTVDEDLFRGGIPDGVDEGVGVLIGLEKNIITTSSEAVYEMHTSRRTFEIQIVGKFNDRDSAWEMVSSLRDLFPVWNQSLHDFTIVSLVPRGDSFVYPVSDNGMVKHYVSVNLILCAVPRATMETPE